MGVCSSCLGGDRQGGKYGSERQHLLSSQNGDYGSYNNNSPHHPHHPHAHHRGGAPNGAALLPDLLEDRERENRELARILAHTSEHLIDIFALEPHSHLPHNNQQHQQQQRSLSGANLHNLGLANGGGGAIPSHHHQQHHHHQQRQDSRQSGDEGVETEPSSVETVRGPAETYARLLAKTTAAAAAATSKEGRRGEDDDERRDPDRPLLSSSS